MYSNKSFAEVSYHLNRKFSVKDVIENPIYRFFENEDSLQFHQSLSGYKPTPLISLDSLAKSMDVKNIWVKDESCRFGLDSFKILGASYAIHKLLDSNARIEVLCAATEGNHGKAVARIGKQLSLKVVIFVPKNVSKTTLENLILEGALVEIVDGDYDKTVKSASLASRLNNWALIQDTSWRNYTKIPLWVMAGYFTIFKEIEFYLSSLKEEIDLIFLQAGVGSFAASATWFYLKNSKLKIPKLILVEPINADGCLYSIKTGKLTTSPGTGVSVMEGLNCNTPSLIAWPILSCGISAFLAISDYYAHLAVKQLKEPIKGDEQIFSKASGAAGLGGMLAIYNAPYSFNLKKELNISSSTNILVINTESTNSR